MATTNGVEPQAVIEALVGDHETRLDELVADERITAEQAEELRAELAERAEALVNGEIGLSPAPFGRHLGLGPPWLSDGAEGDGESSTAGA